MLKVNKKDTTATPNVVLVSLLLTLNILHLRFWYFHCWLWTIKCRLGIYLLGSAVTKFKGILGYSTLEMINGKNFQKQPPEVLCKKDVLRNFGKFTGKHLCLRLFFNKVAGRRPATLFKKSLWDRCLPVNFPKFLRTPFIQNTSGDCFWILESDSLNPNIGFRSSHQRFTGKKLCQGRFFIKAGGLRPAILL